VRPEASFVESPPLLPEFKLLLGQAIELPVSKNSHGLGAGFGSRDFRVMPTPWGEPCDGTSTWYRTRICNFVELALRESYVAAQLNDAQGTVKLPTWRCQYFAALQRWIIGDRLHAITVSTKSGTS
jgi:hypothetical protein